MVARLLLAAALLAAATGSAVAQDAKERPFKASDYPVEVRKVLSNAVLTCREVDGGTVTFAADTVRKVDLTGDGRDDYIITKRNTKCSSFPFIFCGSGGCELDIVVALPNGQHRKVFSSRVRGYEIRPGRGARLVHFDMHGGYCGDFGPAECVKKRRISARPFAFRDR